jgi:hypothetical protein
MRILSRGLTACIVWLLGIPPAFAASSKLSQAELAELEGKVCTMYVVQQLRLTPAQKRELLRIRAKLTPVAEEYVRMNEAWHRDLRKYLKLYVGHYVLHGEYPTGKLQRALEQVEVGWSRRVHFIRTRSAPIADPFADSLSDRQKERLGKVTRSPFWVVGAHPIYIHAAVEDRTDPKASARRRGMVDWQRARWGVLTRAGYFCLAPYLEEALGVKSPSFPHWWDAGARIVEVWGEGVATRLTFLAGLNLDEAQLRMIAKTMRKCVPELEPERLLYVDVGEKCIRNAYTKALQKAEKTLARNRRFSEEDMRALVKIREAEKQRATKGLMPQAKVVAKVQAVVEKSLTESQIVRMITANRCMMPVRDAADAVRAGLVVQDRLNRIGKHLDLARQHQNWGTEACDGWWRQRMYEFTGGEGAFQRLTEPEKEETIQTAWRTVEEARRMSGDQYVAKRDGLCRDLLLLDKGTKCTDADLLRKLDDREWRKERTQAVIANEFCGQFTLALIEERLKQLEGGKRSGRRKRRK